MSGTALLPTEQQGNEQRERALSLQTRLSISRLLLFLSTLIKLLLSAIAVLIGLMFRVFKDPVGWWLGGNRKGKRA